MGFAVTAVVFFAILFGGAGAFWAWKRRCCGLGRIVKRQEDIEMQIQQRPPISNPTQQVPQWQQPMYQQPPMVYGGHHQPHRGAQHFSQPVSPPQPTYTEGKPPYHAQQIEHQCNREPSRAVFSPQKEQQLDSPYRTPSLDMGQVVQAQAVTMKQPKLKSPATSSTKKSHTSKPTDSWSSHSNSSLSDAREASSPVPSPLRLKAKAGSKSSNTTSNKKTLQGQDLSGFDDICI